MSTKSSTWVRVWRTQQNLGLEEETLQPYLPGSGEGECRIECAEQGCK